MARVFSSSVGFVKFDRGVSQSQDRAPARCPGNRIRGTRFQLSLPISDSPGCIGANGDHAEVNPAEDREPSHASPETAGEVSVPSVRRSELCARAARSNTPTIASRSASSRPGLCEQPICPSRSSDEARSERLHTSARPLTSLIPWPLQMGCIRDNISVIDKNQGDIQGRFAGRIRENRGESLFHGLFTGLFAMAPIRCQRIVGLLEMPRCDFLCELDQIASFLNVFNPPLHVRIGKISRSKTPNGWPPIARSSFRCAFLDGWF